jgi:hypothetical protein
VLSAHQGGGEPLRLMPLEITRCLHVPGAELAPPTRPVRRGPGRVMAVDTPWPNGQACHSCGSRHLVPASGCRRHRWVASAGATLGTSLRPGLGASARLVPLATLAAARRGRGLPFFSSPWKPPLFPSEM